MRFDCIFCRNRPGSRRRLKEAKSNRFRGGLGRREPQVCWRFATPLRQGIGVGR